MKWTWIRMIHINSRIEDWFAGDFGVFLPVIYIMGFAMQNWTYRVLPHSFLCFVEMQFTQSAGATLVEFLKKKNHHSSNIFESAPEHWIFYLWVLVWCCDAYIENVWSLSECWSLMLPECTKFWLTLLSVPSLIPFHLFLLYFPCLCRPAPLSLSILGIVKYHSDVYHIF